MAEQADKHELYELSVQNVENEVEFLRETFKQIRGRTPHVLREDFCGTASACCEWVRQGEEYQAIGVDIDPDVLEWGRNNRLSRLDTVDRARVSLLESDVLTVETPQVDLLTAFNFSYFIFDTRDTLRDYFRKAREALTDEARRRRKRPGKRPNTRNTDSVTSGTRRRFILSRISSAAIFISSSATAQR